MFSDIQLARKFLERCRQCEFYARAFGIEYCINEQSEASLLASSFCVAKAFLAGQVSEDISLSNLASSDLTKIVVHRIQQGCEAFVEHDG